MVNIYRSFCEYRNASSYIGKEIKNISNFIFFYSLVLQNTNKRILSRVANFSQEFFFLSYKILFIDKYSRLIELQNLKKFRENLWSIPLIGGALILISLLTPVAVNFNSYGVIYIWIWGLAYSGYSNYATIPGLLAVPSIVFSIFIFFSALVIINSANRYRKSRKLHIEFLLISSASVLISVILWVVFVEIAWIVVGLNFWGYYIPTFGLFGIFIGSLLGIYGHFIVKKYNSGSH